MDLHEILSLLKIFDGARACAQRAAVHPVDDPERKALAEFPYGLSPQWWSEVALISDAIAKQIADKKSDTTTVEEAQDRICTGHRVYDPQPRSRVAYQELYSLYRDLYFALGNPGPLGRVLPSLIRVAETARKDTAGSL